jgi:hypothetical protein
VLQSKGGGGLGVNLLQNDGTRNGHSFILSTSKNSQNVRINEDGGGDGLSDSQDLAFGGGGGINQDDEEILSASSFLSKSSSKFEIDALEEEAEDKEIKSQFDSSSSDSSSGSEEEKDKPEQPAGLKGRLSFLKRTSTLFTKEEAKPAKLLGRSQTIAKKPGAVAAQKTERREKTTKPQPDLKQPAPAIQRSRTMTHDIAVKPKRNTAGYYDKQGWILKKATTTYMGMANWQRRYLVLKNEKLYLYDGDTPKDLLKAKKTINMRNTKCVCYHYDPNAPIKSQKLDKNEKNDKSRFDIYTPGRIFNLKSENEDSF